MGLLGRLFGKSGGDAAADRCNECGMTGGRHTDWCPLAVPDAQKADAGREPRPDTSRGAAG